MSHSGLTPFQPKIKVCEVEPGHLIDDNLQLFSWKDKNGGALAGGQVRMQCSFSLFRYFGICK